MIYLIRHGQTDQNVAWRIQGQKDFPLNETGIRQAEAARDALKELGISFDKVISSPLSRAVRTAEIVTGADGAEASKAPEIILDDRLKEMDYGPYEGADLKNLPEALKEFFSDFNRNPAPEGVEQLPDLVKRLGGFLEAIKPDIMEMKPGENVLLSTHAIALKAALEYLTPGSNGAYWSKYLPNCGMYAFDLVDGEYTVPEEFVYEIKDSVG
jgi:broad specificity phosphatase PhoE